MCTRVLFCVQVTIEKPEEPLYPSSDIYGLIPQDFTTTRMDMKEVGWLADFAVLCM